MKKPLPFLLMWVFLSQALFSQSEWTLETCLAIAKTRSPRLQAARNLTHATELSLSELSTTKLPQFSINAGSVFAPDRGQFGYDPAITDGGQLGGRVILQQSIYDGGIRSLKSDQLSLEVEQEKTAYRLTDRDLTFAVETAFIEALRAQRETQLQQQGVEQLSDYLDLVKRLVKGGSAGATDILKTDVQLSGARIALLKARESAALAAFTLAELMGISPDSAVVPTGSLENLIPLNDDSSDTRQGARSVSNLELAISEMEFRKSLVDIELTRREKSPLISLVGDAGILSSGDNLRLSPPERVPVAGFSLGVSVDVPLFNWGATDLRIQQKELASENVRLQKEVLSRSVNAEARRLRLQLHDARERLQAAQLNIKSAEDNFLLTKSKFAGGGSLSLEVLSAQQLLTDTKLSELQALADIQNLQARIEQLLTN